MADLQIQWEIKRLDEGEEPDPRFAGCLLEIEGRIECGGETAGMVDAHYLFSENPTMATLSDPRSMEHLHRLWRLDRPSGRRVDRNRLRTVP